MFPGVGRYEIHRKSEIHSEKLMIIMAIHVGHILWNLVTNLPIPTYFVNLQFAAKLPCTVTLFIAVHGNKQL